MYARALTQARGGDPKQRQPTVPRCSATAPAAAVAGRSSLLSAAVEKLFNFPPVYAAAVAQV